MAITRSPCHSPAEVPVDQEPGYPLQDVNNGMHKPLKVHVGQRPKLCLIISSHTTITTLQNTLVEISVYCF